MKTMNNTGAIQKIQTVEFLTWLESSVNRYAMPDVRSGRIQMEDVEDIFQDAYVHFQEKVGHFDESRGNWCCWRGTVLKRFYLDAKAKLGRRYYDGRLSDNEAEERVLFSAMSSLRADSAVRVEDYVSAVEKGFGTLTSSEKQVAELKMSGYDKSEIMERLGMSGASVDRHWCCAKAKLDQFLANYYFA